MSKINDFYNYLLKLREVNNETCELEGNVTYGAEGVVIEDAFKTTDKELVKKCVWLCYRMELDVCHAINSFRRGNVLKWEI